MNKPAISVVGLGFVGLSLALVNAKKGFFTVAIDNNEEKIKKNSSGKTPFYEPLLDSYLHYSIKSKMIHFTRDLHEILNTDITFVTVGTQPSKQGEIDLSQLKSVTNDLAKILKEKKKRHLVVIKSTVVPETTKIISKRFKNTNVGILFNPEFLREGSGIHELLKHHLIVIGEENKKDGDALERYYLDFYEKPPEILRTSTTTAELIKYANNAFLATKISFINSIANICQNIPDSDVNTIAHAIGKDTRIGP